MNSSNLPETPIDALREILNEAGSDVAAIFGPALTIFAGARAASKEDREKLVDLARLITNSRP